MLRVNCIAGIMTAAAYAACGGDGSDVNQPTTRPANSISIVDRAETRGTAAFNPNPLAVSLTGAGEGVVNWYNDDEEAAGGQYGGANGTIHNIASDNLVFQSSGNIVPGARFQHRFETSGTYDYHCNIHLTMRGTITVTD